MKDPQSRLADFAARAADSPDDVQTLPGLGRIIAVHAMADESAVLARLGLTAEDCDKVDLYWEYGGDVYFVEFLSIVSYGSSDPQPVGMFGRRTWHGLVTLHVCVSEAIITSSIVATALQELARSLQRSPRPTFDEAWIPLGDSHLVGTRK